MNLHTYSVETYRRICNDNTGEYWEVGPDADGMDMVELRSYGDDGKVAQTFVMPQRVSTMIPGLIIACAREIEGKGKDDG